MKRLVEMLAAVGRLERIAIVHTHALPERLAELRTLGAHLLPYGDILTEDITPVIGAHIGPNAVGFAAIGAAE
jgi:fatty acid-binding protein DegV